MINLIYLFFVNLTFVGIIVLLICFFVYFLNKEAKKFFLIFFDKFGYLIIFLITLISISGSLIFSEFFNWSICKLCWYQRIFIYSQLPISLIAFKLKDKKGYFYHFWLSFFGFLTALFHYLIQRGMIKNIDCNLIFNSDTCPSRVNFDFGFISIPFMALVAFLMIIFISLIMIKNKLK